MDTNRYYIHQYINGSIAIERDGIKPIKLSCTVDEAYVFVDSLNKETGELEERLRKLLRHPVLNK